MENVSLESLKRRIYKGKTAEYFEEVYRSYINNNFRSAIVMLYSVVIVDLLFKMQDLYDLYGDKAANDILKNVAKIRDSNPKKSDWEIKLIDEVWSRTKFLEPHDYSNIKSLQEHRHLSAHPTLKRGVSLYSPNRDTVKSHMVNMLEGVLVKPPIFSKSIFRNFIIDVEETGGKFATVEDLEKYLYSRYLKNLSSAIVNDIFRRIWKLVFFVRNERCDKNRDINIKVLKVLYRRNEKEVKEYLRKEPDLFVFNIGDKVLFEYLVNFLYGAPGLFECFSESAQLLMRNVIVKNDNLHIVSWFIYDDVNKYIDNVEQLIPNCNTFSIVKYFIFLFYNYSKDYVVQVSIKLYTESSNFDQADTFFVACVNPSLKFYCYDNFVTLLTGIEENSQCYLRKRASADHKLIKESCDKAVGSRIDYNRFPKFLASLK